MSKSIINPLNFGDSLHESLSLLHQRLLGAEEEGAKLARKMGVSREEKGTGLGDRGTVSSQCESLVARVCRLETLLHTLKLRVFRIETERELKPAHTARLQEQLQALQEQCEEDRRSSQREVKRLRDQLQQQREETQREDRTLREQLHISQCAQMDSAVVADELEKDKVQMSQKLQQMNEELLQETSARLEAEKSHQALLQRVQEMESAVEKERQQVKILQAECHALHAAKEDAKAVLQEKMGTVQTLQSDSQQLRDQSGEKESLLSKLISELKSVSIELQKEQQENAALVRVGEELRSAVDKVQGLNDQLKTQCSDLSSALRSLTEENTRLQASLMGEQERMARCLKDQDLQLDTAKRHMQCELQGALADRLLLKKELEVLRLDHTKLQQSSTTALESAVSHQELLERTIERLRGELRSAVLDVETTQKENEEVRAELRCVKMNCRSLQEKLKQKNTDPLHNTLEVKAQMLHTPRTEREVELQETRQEIVRLTELVDTVQKAKRRGRKAGQQEVCELKKALDDEISRSRDLSRANQELRERVCELENLLSNQKHHHKQQLDNGTDLDKSQRIKDLEAELKSLEVSKKEYEKKCYEQSQSLLQLRSEMACLQAELLRLSSGQQGELQGENDLVNILCEKCEMLERCVVNLREERDEMEMRMKEVSLESQQISENLQEAHSWFRCKFESLKCALELNQVEPQKYFEESQGNGNEGPQTAPTQDHHKEAVCTEELEFERWASTLQRWKTKRDQERFANGYKNTTQTHST